MVRWVALNIILEVVNCYEHFLKFMKEQSWRKSLLSQHIKAVTKTVSIYEKNKTIPFNIVFPKLKCGNSGYTAASSVSFSPPLFFKLPTTLYNFEWVLAFVWLHLWTNLWAPVRVRRACCWLPATQTLPGVWHRRASLAEMTQKESRAQKWGGERVTLEKQCATFLKRDTPDLQLHKNRNQR